MADYNDVFGNYYDSDQHVNAPLPETPTPGTLAGCREFTKRNSETNEVEPLTYVRVVHPRCMLDENTVCPAHDSQTGGTHPTACAYFCFGDGPSVDNPIRPEHFPPATIIERLQNYCSLQRDIANDRIWEDPEYHYGTIENGNMAYWTSYQITTVTPILYEGRWTSQLTLKISNPGDDPRILFFIGDTVRFISNTVLAGRVVTKIVGLDYSTISSPCVANDTFRITLLSSAEVALTKIDTGSSDVPTVRLSKTFARPEAWSDARQTGKLPFYCVMKDMTWESAQFPEDGVFELLGWDGLPCRIYYPQHTGEAGAGMAATFGVQGQVGSNEWTDILTAADARWARIACVDNVSTKIYLGTVGAQGQTGLSDLMVGYDRIKITYQPRTPSPKDYQSLYDGFLAQYEHALQAEIDAVTASDTVCTALNISVTTYTEAVYAHENTPMTDAEWYAIRNSFPRGLSAIEAARNAGWIVDTEFQTAVDGWIANIAEVENDQAYEIAHADPFNDPERYAAAEAWNVRWTEASQLIHYWEEYPSIFGEDHIFEQLRLSWEATQTALGVAGVSPCADSCIWSRPLPVSAVLGNIKGVDNILHNACWKRNELSEDILDLYTAHSKQCWLMGKCPHFQPGPCAPPITMQHFAELFSGNSYFIRQKTAGIDPGAYWNWMIESNGLPSLFELAGGNYFLSIPPSARPVGMPVSQFISGTPFGWYEIETDEFGDEQMIWHSGAIFENGAYNQTLEDFAALDCRGLFPRVCGFSAYNPLYDGEEMQ